MISDPVPFLANAALIAHSDGKLSSSELGQLELIRTELNFKKGDFNKAVTLVEKGTHELVTIGTFADQVKNLECMLRVAYADGELAEEESRLVSEFAARIGISQDQMNRIAYEVLGHLSNRAKMCSSCGSTADPDAKFCPKCGTSLQPQKDESVPVDFEIPTSGISIEFCDSTAASFTKALQIAKESGTYQSCQKNKKTWHLATYPSGSLIEAIPLAEALNGIRNRRVFLDGEEKLWEEIFGFTWCASQRRIAYRPMEYCFGKDENRLNSWGCKQAGMDWTEWANWFSYGAWEKAGVMGSKVVWRFDKNRIRHELATNLYRYRYCPHMVPRLAQAVINRLPDTVSPESDKNWTWNRDYDELPGAIKVIEREGKGILQITHEFWSNGVRPKGLTVFADVVSKALADIRYSGVSAKALTSKG